MQSWFPMEQDSFHRTGNTFLLNCLSATLCSCFSSAATCAWKKFIFSMFINCQCEQNLSFSYNPSCNQEQCTCAHWRYNRSCKNSKWWLRSRTHILAGIWCTESLYLPCHLNTSSLPHHFRLLWRKQKDLSLSRPSSREDGATAKVIRSQFLYPTAHPGQIS